MNDKIFHSTFINVHPDNDLNFMWQNEIQNFFKFEPYVIDRLYHYKLNSLVYSNNKLNNDGFEKCDYHLIVRLVNVDGTDVKYVEFYVRYSTNEMTMKGYTFSTENVNLFMNICLNVYEEFKDKWDNFILPSLKNDGIHISLDDITDDEKNFIFKHNFKKSLYDDYNRHHQFKCFDDNVNFGILNQCLGYIRKRGEEIPSFELLQLKNIDRLYHFDIYDDDYTIIARVPDDYINVNNSLPLYVEMYRKDGEERVFFMTDVFFFIQLCRRKYGETATFKKNWDLIKQSLMDEGINLDITNDYIKANFNEFVKVQERFYQKLPQ